MLDRKQTIVAGTGASSVLLCFFLEIVSNNFTWGGIAIAVIMYCGGRIYWLQVRQSDEPQLLESGPVNVISEEVTEGQFREEEPHVKKAAPQQAAQQLPVAPEFPHTLPDMDDDNFILGYTLEETGVGAFAQTQLVPVKDHMDEGVMSTAVIGKPKRGKTTLLYFFIAQMIMKNSDVMIFDPHATLAKLKGIFPYAHDCKTILSHVPDIHQELTARMKRYEENGGVCLDNPFWLVVDELPLLSLYERMHRKTIKEEDGVLYAIQRVVLEGRKFRMYCLVAGQSMPATVIPTLARDNFASRYAFFCSNDHARMSDFSKDAIKTLLPKLRMAIGRCILDAATMPEAMIVAIPYTTADHIYTLVRSRSYSGINQFSPVPPVQSNMVDIPGFRPIDRDLAERILDVARSGLVTKRGDICDKVGINHRFYPAVRHLCNEHGLLSEKVKNE